MSFGIKRTKADVLFSNYIRERAGYKCERCRKEFEKPAKNLHCSHFWSRRNRSVRFDSDNAASLCFSCHRYFTENPSEHSGFFLKRLGQKRYDNLTIRARTPQKVDEKAIAFRLKLELENLKQQKQYMSKMDSSFKEKK
jgi:hypothetical protein